VEEPGGLIQCFHAKLMDIEDINAEDVSNG